MANTLVNVEVYTRRGEPLERAIKRFIKKTKKEGIIEECRERQYYKKPSQIRNELKRKNRRTNRK
jgi:small subunit ribosomal protein S21|tara:strand:+ start:1175 stop:1369 length:195 start_codon:yes stop_codon:yes gene_type:complete